MKNQYSIEDLTYLMARLREPGYGCPWDLAQSYKTIVPSTLEEAYEVVDAIEQENYSQLKEELGDLLFQVIFYSQLAAEEERFDFKAVVSSITEKLLRRHPHVFPEGSLDSRVDPAAVDPHKRQVDISRSWEQIKKQERQIKGEHGILDDIPIALPAVVRAAKLQKRAASVGFDWTEVQSVYDKLEEEITELKQAVKEGDREAITEEMGDLLFTAVNLARHLQVEPETALRAANNKFERRFRYMEDKAGALSQTLEGRPLERLEQWWGEAKQELEKNKSDKKDKNGNK